MTLAETQTADLPERPDLPASTLAERREDELRRRDSAVCLDCDTCRPQRCRPCQVADDAYEHEFKLGRYSVAPRRKPGRPPAGQDGTETRNYPRVRISPELLQLVNVRAATAGVSARLWVEEALRAAV